MKILSVIPLKKGIPKGNLTYFTNLKIPEGHIVSVPIRNKKTLALVIASKDLEGAKSDVKGMDFNLRKVAEDKGPSIFSREFVDAAEEVSKYFALPERSATASLLPNIFIEEYSQLAKFPKETPSEYKNPGDNVRSEKLLFQYPFSDRISVYKTLIRESFARKKSVFMVLPTEFDIEKWRIELSRGIEQFVFAFHSSLSTKKIIRMYQKLGQTLNHPILILGTAPFLSIPRGDVSTIILEHESSGAYRTIKRPYLDLRVFAEIYASKINAKFIQADDLLRFETIARQDEDHLHPLHPLSFRIESQADIVVLLREERKMGDKFKIFEENTRQEISRALENKRNVFIFSLRKGLATVTVCRDCGDTLSCTDCSSPLVLYISKQNKKRMFVCNRCQKEAPSGSLCRICGGWDLAPYGIGTDTVYDELKKMFPKVKIWKLDKKSAKSASGAKKIVGDFEEEEGGVLVGTEMAFFYLKKQIALAVVASFETLWSVPNFKMGEKALQIVQRLAGATTDKIIIQTKNTKLPAMDAIGSGNMLKFFRDELADRKKLGYPPYIRFIKISHLGDKDEMQNARKFLERFFTEYSPEIFSGFVANLRGKYTTNALIKIDTRKWSLPSLSLGSTIEEGLHQKLVSLPVSFTISVDPEDLL